MSERGRRLAFATVMLAFAMDVVDSTIVNTAIPAIQSDLAAGGHAIQWVIAGYFLSFAVLLVTGGRLGDLYGYRRLFLVGVASFTLASLACGLAATAEQLVAFRMLQGATAAIMAPQVMALVQLLFTPLERVSRLAVFGLVGGVAAIAGPILGGFLVEADIGGLGWREIFLINGPVGLAALLAGWWLLPEGRSAHPLRLDIIGMLLLGAALVLLLFPLIQGPEYGWPWWCSVLLAAGPVSLLLFWRHARRRTAREGSALIAPELFHQRTFSLGMAATLFFSTATAGLLMILSITLQRGLGYSAFEAALIHVPFGLGVMGGISLIGRRALPRLGKKVVMIGVVVMIAGCGGAALAMLADAAALLPLLVALLLAGIGMGMIAGPLPPVTLAHVDRGHAGVAGGMQKGVQQIGGAIGIAAIGTLFFTVAARANIVHAFASALVLVGLLLGGVLVTAIALPRDIFGPHKRLGPAAKFAETSEPI